MRCKVCGDTALVHPWDVPDGLDRGGPWSRCLACGSDSSSLGYADVRGVYGPGYGGPQRFGPDADFDGLVREQGHNCDVLARYRTLAPSAALLDVGACEGAGMVAARRAGWEADGFDVFAAEVPGVVVADRFAADLMPRRYGAVMVREVIEHVEDWRGLLAEVREALLPGGLAQVQTPRPLAGPDPHVYQRDHLQVFSVAALRLACVEAGFRVLAWETWATGQMAMLRRAP